MKRKSVIIIIVIVVIILLAVSGWLIYKKFFKDKTTDEDQDQDPPPPPPTYSGGGGYSTSSFPIKKGMSGPMVEVIQSAINKKCIVPYLPSAKLDTDGKFGSGTLASLNSCYKVTEVSEALFQQMKNEVGAGVPTGNQYAPYANVEQWKAAFNAAFTTAKSGSAPGFKFNGKTYSTSSGTVCSSCSVVSSPVGETAIGKLAYPKGTYSNVRDSAKVSSFNLLGKVNSPNVVGRITNVTFGAETPRPYRWYQVGLLTPLMTATGQPSPGGSKTGWVREDTIKIS